MSSTGKSATPCLLPVRSPMLEEARDRKNSRVAENSTDFSIRRKSMRERDVSWNLGCVVNLGGMGRIYLVVTPVE